MSNKIRLSELKNVIEQPSQAHGISEVTSGPLKIDQPSQAHRMKDIYFGSQKRAGREAKPKKDKWAKSGTEPQQTVAKLKTSDPNVFTMRKNNSFFKNLITAFRTRLVSTNPSLRSK